MSSHLSASRGGNGHRAATNAGVIGAATTGVGASIVTLVAGACCASPILAPLIVGVMGASGAAWAVSLRPYTWWILGGAGLALAAGFWTVYRPRARCEMSDAPRARGLRWIADGSLWLGAGLWTTALVLRLFLPQ